MAQVLERILEFKSPALLAALLPDLAIILNASANFSAYNATLVMQLVVWQPWVIGRLKTAFDTLGQQGRLDGQLVALSNASVPLASDLFLPWLWSSRCAQHLSFHHLAACTDLLSHRLLADLTAPQNNNKYQLYSSGLPQRDCCWRLLQCCSTRAGMHAIPAAVPKTLFARLRSDDLLLRAEEEEGSGTLRLWRNVLFTLLGLVTFPAHASSDPAERACCDIISECALEVTNGNNHNNNSCFAYFVLLAACAHVNNAAAILHSFPHLVPALLADTTAGAVKPRIECTEAKAQLRAILSPITSSRSQDSPPLRETKVNWRAIVANQDTWVPATSMNKRPSHTTAQPSAFQSANEGSLRAVAALPCWDCHLKKDLATVAVVLRAATGEDGYGEGDGAFMMHWTAAAVFSVVMDASAAVEVLAILRHCRAAPLLFFNKHHRHPSSFPHLNALLEDLVESEMPALQSALAAIGRPLASFLPLWWQQSFVGTVPWCQVQNCTTMLLRDGPTALVYSTLAVLKHLAPHLIAAASRGSLECVSFIASDFVLEDHAAFLATVKDAHGPAIDRSVENELVRLWRDYGSNENGEAAVSGERSAQTRTVALEAGAEWL